MEAATVLWRRLDHYGHDACRLVETADGWLLEGGAAYRHDGGAAHLTYRVGCDPSWRAMAALVRGWVGADRIDVAVERSANGEWTVNGRVEHQLDGCEDLDFAFTPATNLIHLRRTSLAVGEAADVPVAWFDDHASRPKVLLMRYERRTTEKYWFEVPTSGYFASLVLRPDGFIASYPGLWEAEP